MPVRDAHDLAESPHILRVGTSISTITSSTYGVVVADMHGSVHVLDKQFEPVSSWVAHVGGRVMHMIERRGYLVTLGVRPSASITRIHYIILTFPRKKMASGILFSKFGTWRRQTKAARRRYYAPPKCRRATGLIRYALPSILLLHYVLFLILLFSTGHFYRPLCRHGVPRHRAR